MLRKSPLKRKTPLKRGPSSQLKRKSPLKTASGIHMEYKAREAYLRQFRGLPCEICGKTHFSKQKSTIHHILKAEMYPEYYYEELNRIVLCPMCHIPKAHDHPVEFMGWLKINHRDKWDFAIAHSRKIIQGDKK